MSARSLNAIYGEGATPQTERYDRARRAFLEHYGPGATAFYRTPGRINLIGEHTDYNGGFVMPVALDKDVLCVVRRRTDPLVRAINVEARYPSFSFELSDDIPPAPRGEWSNYFQGAGQEICRRFGDRTDVVGMDVLVSGQAPYGVPRGSGLSSSTALTVSAALALVELNEIDVPRADLAHLCGEAEWYVGTRGGMMDQFSALLGRRDHALFLDCRPSPEGVYTTDHVPLPGSVQVVLLTSGVQHQNVRGEFNQRVAECKVGVQLLRRRTPSVGQLRDVTPRALGLDESDFWAVIDEALPVQASAAELIGRGLDAGWLDELIADHGLDAGATFAVRGRCRHVLTENARVLEGVAALRAGQVEKFGRIMARAHASMSADYGASCPQVDALVEIVSRRPGVLGARITGAGWGGGVVALVERGSTEGWIDGVRAQYTEETGLACDVFVCRPGDGAGQVTALT